MVEDSMEISAPSVDEAIILGLTRMGVTREDVIIEILNEGSRGFLGLGARQARVRLTQRPAGLVEVALTPIPTPPAEAEPRPVVPSPASQAAESARATANLAPAEEIADAHAEIEEADDTLEEDEEADDIEREDEEADEAEEYDEESDEEEGEDAPTAGTTPSESRPGPATRPETPVRLPGNLDHQSIEAIATEVAEHLFAGLRVKTVLSWRQEERVTLWISLRGRDADMLVGPRAQTLNSVQYLFRTLLHHRVEGDYNVVIDADGYRKRRRGSLESLARKKADQAVSTGRTIRLRPMPAHERRVIHMVLRQDERVQTESIGKGENRAITIIPIRKSDK